MRVLKSVFGTFLLLLFFFATQTHLSSCQKEIIKKDTLYLKDTITLNTTDTIKITDTLTIIDSINCACYDLSDGLVAYYNFNNGNLNDSSGYQNNIIFNNAVKTQDRFGRANNAYSFDGTSTYMQVKNSSSLNPLGAITLMGIVKLNDFYEGTCHANQIFQKGTIDQNEGVYSLRVQYVSSDCYSTLDKSKEIGEGFYGDYGYSAGASDETNFIQTNQWYTFVYTFDGQVSKFYVNGMLKSTVNGSAIFHPNSNDLFIGRAESNQYPYWWNGTIDEIRIYNKALCEGAVKQLSSLSN
jgi:hypothetical protein